MTGPPLDFTPLRHALAMLVKACGFWTAEPESSPLKRHLRSAVVQSFEFTYELSVRMLRRTLIERAEAADLVADLSFNDLLRKAADAGLLNDPSEWRMWREMRNTTSHAYDEVKAHAVASNAARFGEDAAELLSALEANVGDA